MRPHPVPVRPKRSWLSRLFVLAAGLALLALADIVVLERIYKPLSERHGVAWSEFELRPVILGREVRMLWWHAAFVPLGLGLFALLGVSGRDVGLGVAGAVLFASGWEDLAYYALQLKPVPPELPWLDSNPAVAWTRSLLGVEHVTRSGLLLAAAAGGALAAIALLLTRRKRAASPPGVTVLMR